MSQSASMGFPMPISGRPFEMMTTHPNPLRAQQTQQQAVGHRQEAAPRLVAARLGVGRHHPQHAVTRQAVGPKPIGRLVATRRVVDSRQTRPRQAVEPQHRAVSLRPQAVGLRRRQIALRRGVSPPARLVQQTEQAVLQPHRMGQEPQTHRGHTPQQPRAARLLAPVLAEQLLPDRHFDG